MDFTIKKYKELIKALIDAKYKFQTYEESISSVNSKRIILRHDVDLLPNNSLRFAKIQSDLGIKGVYYFRAVPESWDEEIIKKISNLGHEIGYHYETMDSENGDIEKAYKRFCINLNALRDLTPVKTICMHGSPLSKFDNRDIWKHYDYKSLDLIGEPYFDLDFNSTYYLTDTGRRWDGSKVSVRDKIMQGRELTNPDFISRKYHSTNEILLDIRSNNFPNSVMFNFHPQRWTDNNYNWIKELLFQNFKNQVKRFLVK